MIAPEELEAFAEALGELVTRARAAQVQTGLRITARDIIDATEEQLEASIAALTETVLATNVAAQAVKDLWLN
jgi:hypothetical protein